MAAHFCMGSGAAERRDWLSAKAKAELEAVVEHIGQPGKGISACDESGRTINPRFEKVGVEASEDKRRAYRQMLFEAPGAADYVSAAILDPETVYQKTPAGVPLPQVLAARGILPGVKPSLQVYKLPGTDGETVMQGLDSLAERLKEYKAAGCVFAKWRSPLTIDVAAGKPSQLAIEANMVDQARYALICQSEGIVPIVEPDLVLAGSHTLAEAVEINARVLNILFGAMAQHGVHLEGCILKVNMVNAGKGCATAYSADDIAAANLACLRRTLPVAVRTVNYLSGGQTLADACARLDAINRLKQAKGGDRYAPWNLSYSWSAAIQMPLFDLCKDASLERDQATGLPLKAMAAMYVDHLRIASSAATGTLAVPTVDVTPPTQAGDVDYGAHLHLHIDAAVNKTIGKMPADPFKAIQQVLFQASLDGSTPPKQAVSPTAEQAAYLTKYRVQDCIDRCLLKLKKRLTPGPFEGVKFLVSDAGDFFTEESKKLKAAGGVWGDITMTAEELAAKDKADAKAKREKEAKAEAERDAADAANLERQKAMEADGKQVKGGLHKFDASEVDAYGGEGTADDLMDAFGF